MAYDEATAEPLLPLAAGDELTTALVCAPWLPSGVTVSSVGTPTSTPSGLTIANVQVNGSTYTKRDTGVVYAIGQVVTYEVSGSVAGRFYTVTFPLTLSNDDVLMAKQTIKGI